jgi:hypothetical protein
MLNLVKLCSDITIETRNDIVVRAICILLSRFSYDFTWEQRDRIQDILSENQPI